jgi:predicted O-methyltransferase YrrM
MAIDLIAPQVTAYLERLVPPRDATLVAMEAEARKAGFPIIGPAVGQLCYMLTRLTGARRIFELGSGYGYSTAWFARGVKENGGGVVHHVVWDDDLSGKARVYLGALGLADLVEFHVGEAVAALRQEAGPFDIIFNDIDKQGYPGALPAIEEKLRPGGALVVDNMLWGGRIFDTADRSPATEGIRAFTKLITEDARWLSSVIPIRDGVLVAWRAPQGSTGAA